jgi:VIT1/CCC1 family predicted Fe2+/Mn2+ transporter
MGASEYLSTKTERPQARKQPLKAALYTGAAYVTAVAVLVLPFLLLSHPIAALCLTLGAALLIIVAFSYYVSVAQELPFGRRFAEMALLSLAVAALSFGIGYLIREVMGVEV